MARGCVVVLALLLLAARPAGAEHEVFYRYTVLGFVKDAQGAPVAARRVTVTRDKTGFAYEEGTDDRGFFVVVTRLGDESVGETLSVRAGGASIRVVARFDPADHVDERGTRVDVEGAQVVERAVWFRSTLLKFIGATRR